MMNDYYQNSDYDFGVDVGGEDTNLVSPEVLIPGDIQARPEVDFNETHGNLPKILLMGPRRGGKTSIQVSYCRLLIF